MVLFDRPPVTLPVIGTGDAVLVRRVYCIGRNYVDHVREMNNDEREPPFYFMKPADALVVGGGAVAYPAATQDLHHEVELALIIGEAGSNVPESHAPELIFGITVAIDFTRRDRQAEAKKMGRPWEPAKAFDGSCPIGSVLPVDGAAAVMARGLTLTLNGDTRQSGSSGDMIWSSAEIIAHISRLNRLEPGDVILTGTPAGVGAVVPGDRLIATVEGVPPLSVECQPPAP